MSATLIIGSSVALCRLGRTVQSLNTKRESSQALVHWAAPFMVLLAGCTYFQPLASKKRVASTAAQRNEQVMSSSWFAPREVASKVAGSAEQVQADDPSHDAGRSRRLHSKFSPDDPGFGLQWGLDAIEAPQAWESAHEAYAWVPALTSEKTVRVAVVDSGCADPSTGRLHPDLSRFVDEQGLEVASPIVHQYTVRNAEIFQEPALDEFGHGVGVAGIISAQTRNQMGMAGVTWRASIDCIRILDERGNSTDKNVARAIELAHQLGDKVINLSVQATKELHHTRAALQAFVEGGGLVVAARGNATSDDVYRMSYPAMYSAEGARWLGRVPEWWQHGVISVGAVREADGYALTSSSLRGGLTLVAPGARVLTLAYGASQNKDCTPVSGEPGLAMCTGTSFAAPFVTGAVALLWSLHPEQSNMEVRNTLVHSAVLPSIAGISDPDVCAKGHTGFGCDAEFGAGMLNLRRMLKSDGKARLQARSVTPVRPEC